MRTGHALGLLAIGAAAVVATRLLAPAAPLAPDSVLYLHAALFDADHPHLVFRQVGTLVLWACSQLSSDPFATARLYGCAVGVAGVVGLLWLGHALRASAAAAAITRGDGR